MTYVPTWEGFVYLAVVTDVFSRKVVGWAFGVHMTSELVIQALDMALFTRKPQDVIHHSDQGSQYTSIAFGNRCKEMGVRPSMGTVGDAYDNAMAESTGPFLSRATGRMQDLLPPESDHWLGSVSVGRRRQQLLRDRLAAYR